MKWKIGLIVFALSNFANAGCLDGNNAQCGKKFGELRKAGKAKEFKELYWKACDSEKLHVTCTVVTVTKAELNKKIRALADKNGTVSSFKSGDKYKLYHFTPAN